LVKISSGFSVFDNDKREFLMRAVLDLIEEIEDSGIRLSAKNKVSAHFDSDLLLDNIKSQASQLKYREAGTIYKEDVLRKILAGSFRNLPQELVNLLSLPENTIIQMTVFLYLQFISKAKYLAYRNIIDDPLVALFLSLLSVKQISDNKLHIIFKRFSDEQSRLFSKVVFTDLKLAKLAAIRLAKLKDIAFRNGGKANSTYADFGGMLIAGANMPIVGFAEENIKIPEVIERKKIGQIVEGRYFLDAFGRTFRYKGNNGEILAIKLQKEGENIKTLYRELEEEGIPRILGVYRIAGISPEQEAMIPTHLKISKAGDSSYPFTGLVYIAEEAYFKFLNDETLSHDQFMQGSLKSLGFLFRQARDYKIHVAPADLFHSPNQSREDDFGCYLWMASLMKRLLGRSTVGKIFNWQGAVEFPNYRAVGMGDLGDMGYFGDLIKPDNTRSAHLASLWKYYGEKAPKYYKAFYLGNYNLGWTLVTGSRHFKLGLLDWESRDKVQFLAEVLHKGFNHGFSIYTGIPEEATAPFLRSVVNWEMFARQMSYFMTRAYVEGIHSKEIPPQIFGPDVKIGYPKDLSRQIGWREAGWLHNGHNPDLGPRNGPFSLQELLRSLFLTTGFMLALRQ